MNLRKMECLMVHVFICKYAIDCTCMQLIPFVMFGIIEKSSHTMYCTEKIIKKELQQCKEDWNTHGLRKNTKSHLPSGIPNNLFSTPEAFVKLSSCDE